MKPETSGWGGVAGLAGMALAVFVVGGVIARAADDSFGGASLATSAAAHPWQDDAALHDVEFAGTRTGWAVGDHGTVWKTADGGESWVRIAVPFDLSLRSVCFLTQESDGNRVAMSHVAWIAARGTQPYSRVGYGVLLKTVDGGKSWQMLAQGQNLPPLNYVKFFGAEQGIAVGESTAEFPTGVLITEDGGATWQSAPGPRSPGWLAASFLGFNDGTVAGPRGRLALVAGTSVAPPRLDSNSLRSIRGIAMADGLTGWAVGDGALVLRTGNGGVSWEPPPGFNSYQLSRFVDLSAVASIEDSAWVAGSPGSTVWMTHDAGETWQRSPTGQSSPIRALHFSSSTHGWAVGDFGSILRTIDGGRSWQVSRGGQRRAAVLAIHSRADRIPFGAITKYAGDEGFRTVTLLVPRRSKDEASAIAFERQAHDAVTTVGGNAAQVGWRLPIGLPDLERDLDALTSEWQKHTEGKLVDVVISNLTAAIRTWRPEMVVIEQPPADDATAVLLRDAVTRAVEEAADPTKHFDHQDLAGMESWQVRKVFLRAAPETQASISIDPYEVLPRLGGTVEAAASLGRSRMLPTSAAPEAEPFVPIDASDEKFTLVSHRELWTGLSIAPGSDARRPQLPLDELQLEAHQAAARKQRNFRGIARAMMPKPAQAAQLVAELRGEVRDLPRPQAALQIAHLANDYRRNGQWDLAEATMIELIDLYPEQPVAAEGMLWLLHLWSSDEMAWQRSRGISLTAQEFRTSRSAITGRMERVLKAVNRPSDDPLKLAKQLAGSPLDDLQLDSALPSQSADDWQSATISFWQQQAVQLSRVISKRLPEAYLVPQVRWPVASVLRRQGHFPVADSLYRRFVSANGDDVAGRVASGEVWLAQPADEMPPHLESCRMATVRPFLDGVLGDDCWQDARELRLTRGATQQAEASSESAIAFLSYDDQFLYFAASVPLEPGTQGVEPQLAGRRHDSDHTGFDRVTLWLDVDRDYATSYRITVDQRGQVSEACWEDSRWNPKLHVAVDADAARWRIEMAIPFVELASQAPRSHDVWAVRITRSIPQVGWQSWIPPFAGEENPESFGIVQFR
ncbi:MAG: YCF48-related protein [Planctomycetota bacterium]|jgi:photosystem II stability/assembly factor-like uncharacterized protein